MHDCSSLKKFHVRKIINDDMRANQSRCRNDATPRQCAVVRLETKYFIHAVNILDSPAPCDVTDDVILTGSLTINHQWSNCVNKLKRTMHYSILTFHFLQILNHHRY